jgi:hypothetical protein
LLTFLEARRDKEPQSEHSPLGKHKRTAINHDKLKHALSIISIINSSISKQQSASQHVGHFAQHKQQRRPPGNRRGPLLKTIVTIHNNYNSLCDEKLKNRKGWGIK